MTQRHVIRVMLYYLNFQCTSVMAIDRMWRRIRRFLGDGSYCHGEAAES